VVETKKDAIQAKKVTYKDWLQNKGELRLHSRYAEERKSLTLTVKKSKTQSRENFRHTLDSNYWQATKMFCQTIWRLHGKRSHQARSIKDQSGALLSNEKDITQQ